MLPCLRSLSFTTGIRVLEEGLLSAGVSFDVFSGSRTGVPEAAAAVSRVSGRGRPSTASASSAVTSSAATFRAAHASTEDVAAAWSQLARLYDAMSDGEVCCVFAHF